MNRIPFFYLTKLLVGIVATTTSLGWLASGNGQQVKPVEIGTRLELFVDRHLIESTKNVELRLKEPRDEGIALKLNQPWEGRFCGYTTVIKDGDQYRMYYRGMPGIGAREVACVAFSKDGKNWSKPEFELYPAGEQDKTNIILADAGSVTHNFCPLLDSNPEAKKEVRYKAIGGSAKSGLFAYTSADGIRWKPIQKGPVLKVDGWVFDSQNLAFWSTTEKCYVMYFRRVVKGIRAIARSTSKDFKTWTKPVQMQYSDTRSEIPRFQLYTNQTQPYYRAPHILLSTAARFMPGRRTISAEQAKQIGVDRRYFGDVSDAVLLTSRGGDRYDVTFQTALLRPGIGAENWVSRTNYPALGIVPTGKHEMSWYVNQNYGQLTAHVRRYTFRIDGISCATADLAGGELITKPITMKGNRLELNYSTSAAGSVTVELQDKDGQPINGFELSSSKPLIGNEIKTTVFWGDNASTQALIGKTIKIRFVLHDAELFSFRFAK